MKHRARPTCCARNVAPTKRAVGSSFHAANRAGGSAGGTGGGSPGSGRPHLPLPGPDVSIDGAEDTHYTHGHGRRQWHRPSSTGRAAGDSRRSRRRQGTVATPTLASVRHHRVPAWYRDAGLGIFVHWGIASVPGWAPREWDIHELLRTRYRDAIPLSPYTEWYENALRFAWSPTARWHRERYGDRPYAAFRDAFERGLSSWDPAAWAERFAAAGARYVVMVTKHHDGYCLWPSAVPNPMRPGWHAPRDLVGELAGAVRARGLRFGVYYSGGIDWSFNPAPIRTPGEFIASVPGGPYPAYAGAQVRELIARYAPDVLWNDIAWPGDRASLVRLWADYYAAVPEGVVNDRWLERGWAVAMLRTRLGRTLADAAAAWHFRRGGRLLPARPLHADTRTPEYAAYDSPRSFAWECVRGMDKSFGYNRASREEDFIARSDLLALLAACRRNGGNLLLNVGPRGEDGGIPEPQLRRLGWLAETGP